MEIVDELYAEIITYLIYDTKEFVWGELSDAQRKAKALNLKKLCHLEFHIRYVVCI